MKNRSKTQKIITVKRICNLLLTIVLFLFSSCNSVPNKETSLTFKLIDIYKTDIDNKLANLKELSLINELKYKNAYSEILKIQNEFNTIYKLIEENKLEIKSELYRITKLTEKNYRYRIAKELEVLSNSDTKKFEKNELLSRILDLNSTVLTELHYNLDATDLRVNRVNIVVIPEKTNLKAGEVLNAQIVIAAIDTTNVPYIKFDNKTIKISDGVGKIQINSTKKGKNKLNGLVYIPNNEYILVYPFNLNFEVN